MFKEEQVINDFFLYNSHIFLEVPSPLSCPEIMAVNFFRRREWGVGIFTKICSHSRQQQQKAPLIKGLKRIRSPQWISLCAVSSRTHIHLIQVALAVRALGLLVETTHVCVWILLRRCQLGCFSRGALAAKIMSLGYKYFLRKEKFVA